MPAELKALLELQARDLAVNVIRQEIAAYSPELAALDEAIAAVRRAQNAAQRDVQDTGERRVAIELKIEEFKSMQERKRQRLEWVRGAKEASNLMAELDLGRSVLAKEEGEWVRTADHVQDAEARVLATEQQLAEVHESQTARRGEIAAALAEAEGRLAVAAAARAAAAKAVPIKLLRQYDRILQGRAPMALYPLHGGSCGHCYTSVPKHRRQELTNGTPLVACEACGVMVYQGAVAGATAEAGQA
ncbi:MAG: hypothetical protein WD934_11510 [Gemmatimonadales bacterium]